MNDIYLHLTVYYQTDLQREEQGHRMTKKSGELQTHNLVDRLAMHRLPY